MLYKTRHSARDFPLGLFILERSKDLPATHQKCIQSVLLIAFECNSANFYQENLVKMGGTISSREGSQFVWTNRLHYIIIFPSRAMKCVWGGVKLAANFAVYSHSLEHSTFIHGLLKENRLKTTTDCTLIAPQKNNTKAKGKEWFILLRGEKKIQWLY